jgi:hypothetical protein
MSTLHLVSVAGFFVPSLVGRRREEEGGIKIDGS